MCCVVCGKGWCADLPAVARLLLISAFLALRSHHRNDKFTFGTMAKGRRKRSIDEEEEIAEGDNVKSFTSERLLRIYGHLSSAHPRKLPSLFSSKPTEKHDWKDYTAFKDRDSVMESGSVYHMIATLVRRGLLMEVSTSGMPLYSTVVTDEMAELLSRSLGIPLQNYMCA